MDWVAGDSSPNGKFVGIPKSALHGSNCGWGGCLPTLLGITTRASVVGFWPLESYIGLQCVGMMMSWKSVGYIVSCHFCKEGGEDFIMFPIGLPANYALFVTCSEQESNWIAKEGHLHVGNGVMVFHM